MDSKPRGRPRQFQEARPTLTIRLRREVRERIEQEAAGAGRSISEQIEYMLEQADRERTVLSELRAIRERLDGMGDP